MFDQLQCIRIQQQQFQILSYIYLDEFHVIKQASPYRFSILCRPYIKSHQLQYQINLQFQFPKNYPNIPLKYQIQPIVGLTRDNIQQVTRRIQDMIYENRNKPIVYQIVQEVRLWIREYLVEGKAYDTYEQVSKKVQEVFERPKFAAFTPVTIESFTAWKKEFDMKQKAKQPIKKQTQIKLTGKQWFLGKKDQQIQDTDQQQSQDQQQDIEDQQNQKKNYDQPENKLFMMDNQDQQEEAK